MTMTGMFIGPMGIWHRQYSFTMRGTDSVQLWLRLSAERRA